MRQSLVIANWKLNGDLGLIQKMAEQFANNDVQTAVKVVICPPAVYLKAAEISLAPAQVKVGAQNCAAQSEGAFTGEISARMLRDSGAEYVLIGHSERRALFAEQDAELAKKVVQAQREALIPVFCIGETLEQREAGEVKSVLRGQLEAGLADADFSQLVIAYEPVWAIGTGKTASPEQAQEVHAMVREWVAEVAPSEAADIQILYGGSVKAENAETLFSQPDIDGGLIGGASLDPVQFDAICKAAKG
ncbi:triose-phosphate isomerase [Aliidiomarina sanyensis]|uniref:Triosephosphate isomerase n=1 Tax=Aliidiomarina sanyensis TaxID=1249555 RepID=A0A432WEW4_9GAMM|nr:triose-phosphate isomerase [Aliidiomarina sanyensis]RUO31402.1 triose-phosphate isomerase [Aliidiomarina sanyensis]